MAHMIEILDKQNVWHQKIIHDEEVYLYIKNLESYINFPENPQFILRYANRFQRAINRIGDPNES
jgi:hypothetical protein